MEFRNKNVTEFSSGFSTISLDNLTEGKQPLSMAEVKAICEAARFKNPKFCLLVLLGVSIGLRIGELVHITKTDLKNKWFVYRKLKQKDKNKAKHRKQIPPAFYTLFKELGFNYTMFEEKLFICAHGRHVWKDYTPRKYLKEYCKIIGLEPERIKQISTHSLRKCFGQNLFNESGKDFNALITVQKALGHADISYTARYIGYDSTDLNKSINRMKLW